VRLSYLKHFYAMDFLNFSDGVNGWCEKANDDDAMMDMVGHGWTRT